jgi:hypothetical protein
MKKSDILDKLGKKEIKAEEIAEEIENSGFLPEILNGISSENPRVRFKSAKILRIVSEQNPEMLYSKMDSFIRLLDSENNILKWNAMDIIANLTLVDSENKFDEIFEKYYGLLSDESMVTAGHVVDNSGKIAKAKPYLQNKITTELLKVESIPRGQECKNILLGKVILSFGQYIDQVKNKEKIISLAKRQLNNTRNATKKKAEKFLIKIENRK